MLFFHGRLLIKCHHSAIHVLRRGCTETEIEEIMLLGQRPKRARERHLVSRTRHVILQNIPANMRRWPYVGLLLNGKSTSFELKIETCIFRRGAETVR